MNSHVAGQPTPVVAARRFEFWRRALSGLTPQVLAIVVALMILRAFSAQINEVPEAAGSGNLGAWLLRVLVGFRVLVIQVAPMLIAIIATANLGPAQGPRRVVALALSVLLSALAGVLLRAATAHGVWEPSFLLYAVLRYSLLGGLLVVIAELYRAEVASNEAAQQAEIDRLTLDREMTEARLEVLQAQIEPHFLFNTLANTRRLYAEDIVAGRTMLEALMRYLQVALPRMRHGESTLAREAELLEAFLRIQRIRMGPRLAFSIDIPPGLREQRVPPTILLTLVENAVKHGLSPSPDGGLIRVTARADGDRLVLTVADTGVGFESASGSGIGLANVTARLAAQFGDRARLTLENNEFGGATATIALPGGDERR